MIENIHIQFLKELKGSEFHKDGAIAENARSPSEDKVRGTTSRCLSDERSVRAGLLLGTRRV